MKTPPLLLAVTCAHNFSFTLQKSKIRCRKRCRRHTCSNKDTCVPSLLLATTRTPRFSFTLDVKYSCTRHTCSNQDTFVPSLLLATTRAPRFSFTLANARCPSSLSPGIVVCKNKFVCRTWVVMYIYTHVYMYICDVHIYICFVHIYMYIT